MIEKLYHHWSTKITMIWGAASLLVVPILAIWLKNENPTNYDFTILMSVCIFTLIVWVYNYILDEQYSSRTYSSGLKRIFDNKKLSTDELGKRVDMYKRMYK